MSVVRISTTAPLPDVRHFFALFDDAPKDDRLLSDPWIGIDDTSFLFSRAAWALSTIASAFRLSRGRTPVVWLPDYFCNDATVPLRNIAQVLFYPITAQLEPNWDVCLDMDAGVRPDIFVLVHYFGRPADSATSRQFCDARGAILVEDAAHVLMPCGAIGGAGDCTIWSLYKHLPLPDGGLLAVRSGGAIDPRFIETALRSSLQSSPTAARWVAKRFLQRFFPSVASRLRAPCPPFGDDMISSQFGTTAAMSDEARRLLSRANIDLPKIAVRRRANYASLVGSLTRSTELTTLLPDADGTWTPYRAVFRASDPDRAEFFYHRFCASGNVVETWPDIAPEVRAQPERHAVALTLRHTVLMMPIHADREPRDLALAYCSAVEDRPI